MNPSKRCNAWSVSGKSWNKFGKLSWIKEYGLCTWRITRHGSVCCKSHREKGRKQKHPSQTTADRYNDAGGPMHRDGSQQAWHKQCPGLWREGKVGQQPAEEAPTAIPSLKARAMYYVWRRVKVSQYRGAFGINVLSGKIWGLYEALQQTWSIGRRIINEKANGSISVKRIFAGLKTWWQEMAGQCSAQAIWTSYRLTLWVGSLATMVAVASST